MTRARQAAHRVVLRTLEQDAYADRAFVGEARGLDKRDRAFAQQLAFGTVQRRLTLDHVLDAYVERRPPAPTRAALHLGLYQLLFLGGVPDRAAVSESVDLVKGERTAGLVNAVLRRVAREGFELPGDAAPAEAAIHHSHPEWLVRLWWDWIGPEETRALLAADNEPAEITRRRNPLVADDQAAGAWVIQSTASQLPAQVLAPEPGERVLDLCAAPGNKTSQLAALMSDRGELVAYERHPGRAKALEERLTALGVTCARVVCADAGDAQGAFDRVLLDPPCSGLGTLQRNPDLRWRATPERIAAVAAEQDRLLAAARRCLAPGGRLVYSVCTLSPAEERLEGDELRRTWPHRDATDGFSVARLG